MKKLIKDIIFAISYKRAVKKADRLSRLDHRKYMVIALGGKLHVVSRRQVKYLISTKRFRKGTRIEDIDRLSLYTTL